MTELEEVQKRVEELEERERETRRRMEAEERERCGIRASNAEYIRNHNASIEAERKRYSNCDRNFKGSWADRDLDRRLM